MRRVGNMGLQHPIFVLVLWLWCNPLPSMAADGTPLHGPSAAIGSKRKLPPNVKMAELESAIWTLISEVARDFPGSDESRVLQGMMYRELGDYAKTVEIWEQVLQNNPQHVEVLTHLGKVALDMEAYSKAVAYWRRALAIHPRLPGLHQDMGFALLEAGQYHDAIEALLQSLMVSPQSGKTLSLLGQCYLQLKNYEQARAMYQRAIQIDPADAAAYYGLMTLSMRLQEPKKADTYRARFKALTREKTHLMRGGYSDQYDLAQMHTGVATLILEASAVYRNHGNTKKTDSLLAWAKQLSPKTVVDHLKRQAMTYQTQRQFAQALAVIKEVTTLEPDNADNTLAMGILSVKIRLFDQAKVAFERTIQLAPQHADGHRELARLYTLLKIKPNEALTLAKRAVKLEGTPEDYYVLSSAYMSKRQIREALAAMRGALDRDPGNPVYQETYNYLQRQTVK